VALQAPYGRSPALGLREEYLSNPNVLAWLAKSQIRHDPRWMARSGNVTFILLQSDNEYRRFFIEAFAGTPRAVKEDSS